MSKILTNKNKIYILWQLYLVILLVRFATDCYLPSLPAITDSFGISQHLTQLTITFYLISFSFSQLFFGPYADRFGRRYCLLLGLCLFLLGSLLCTFSFSIYMLLVGRFIMGMGAGSCPVANRSIASDLYQGPDLVRVIAKISFVITFALMIAPVIGGEIQTHIGWRGNFIFMTCYTTLLLMIIIFLLPETISEYEVDALQWRPLINTYNEILRYTRFVRYAVCAGLSFSGMIAFFQLSPFIFISKLNMLPSHYGQIMLLMACPYLTGGMMVKVLIKTMSNTKILLIGIALMLIAGISLLYFDIWAKLSSFTVIIPSFIYILGFRFVMPIASSAGLSLFTKHKGSASALLGWFLMMSSSVVSFLVGVATFTPMLLLALVYLTLALVLLVIMIIEIRSNYIVRSVQIE